MSNQTTRKPTYRKFSTSSNRQVQSSTERNRTTSQTSDAKSNETPSEVENRSRSTNSHEDCSSDWIDTESQIYITRMTPQIFDDKSKTTTKLDSLTKSERTKYNLNLICKYTSDQSSFNDFDIVTNTRNKDICAGSLTDRSTDEMKTKRCFSSTNDIDESSNVLKRRKPSEINHDNNIGKITQLPHNSKTTANLLPIEMKKNTTDSNTKGFPRQLTARKSTIRKALPNSQNTSESWLAQRTDTHSDSLIIELDDDSDVDNQFNSINSSQDISHGNKNSTTSGDSTSSPSPKLTVVQNSINNRIEASSCPATRSSNYFSNQTNDQTIHFSSPIILNKKTNDSLNSPNFENSFLSTPRIINIQTRPIVKVDSQTTMNRSTIPELINKLLVETSLNKNVSRPSIDFDPVGLARQCFRECFWRSEENKRRRLTSSIFKQCLSFGRYEIEVVYPIDQDKMISTIYVCDLCLKHFYGSEMASKRHALKCLQTSPPGQLIFTEKDLAIFCISKKELNREQRIYVDYLFRLIRLFVKPNNRDNRRINDEFLYYILCRRDPVLSDSQTYRYRFLGYFSRRSEQLSNNLCCLFVLPPFAERTESSQMLIAFSYFLSQQEKFRTTDNFTPERPVDQKSLSLLNNYWCETILSYLTSDVRSTRLETLVRQTSIDPRDILFTLYSNRLIYVNPNDESSIYLVKPFRQSNVFLFDEWKKKFSKFLTDERDPSNSIEQFEEILID